MSVKIKQPVKNKVAKVPVVMQLEALECGAACLCMVMAYYNKWIPLEQVRSDCGVSRDGSKARNVLVAARNYGMQADGYRYEPDSLKEEGTFPCIIHWNFNHFVVLNGFKGDYAIINDPARGTVKVPMSDFDRSFTGICLMFEPTEDFKPEGHKRSVLSFVKDRMEGAMVATVFVILVTVISSLMSIISPGFSRVFVDRLLSGRNPQWIYPFIVGLSVFSFVQVVVMAVQEIYSLKINGKLAIAGNTSYMWKILRMPVEFFSQRMAGDIQQRQEANATIAATLVNQFAPLAINIFMMVFYLVVMIRYSVPLTVIGLLSIAVNALISNIVSMKRVNITRVQMRDEGKLAGATTNGIELIETIKASGAENGFFEKWAGYQASVNTQQIKYSDIDHYLGMAPSFVSMLANSAVLLSGVYLVMKGQFTIGMIMAFQTYLTGFTAPADTLISTGQSIQEMRTQMERIEDVMKYPVDPAYKDDNYSEGSDYSKITGLIEMKHVTFGYSRLEPPLIKDFNMTVKPGDSIAFVGMSGCGKSTLSKLISGLYQPWEGEILFDGKKMQDIDRGIFTGSLAVVDQDITLYEDTIANNIKMWDSSIEDFEMILAARDAQIHDDIMERDKGYDHILSEGGKDFSGGQRQRLEIARVLAQDPTVIILDEATSALDAKTEYEVVKAIKDRGITCIVIAHRLSTIRDSNEIIVMDQGEVMERGTHDELYAKGGLYTQLVTNE
ncbi:MAG: NHLP family bacteriocin export ABC transporter peptidase/permease/ATPase subunit [Lachnospiraceae bacterium]|nr:NHLP family bacteriocin export ABC transporter peptidase/permease/ATPase subunit [Lachnospiraceae bacterium]